MTIVGELKAFWKSAVGYFVSADVVGEVYEVCSLCTYPSAYCYGIINQLMAMVRLLKPEGVDDERVDIVNIFIFRLFYALHVGYVGEAWAVR